jgi:hypothetical protein
MPRLAPRERAIPLVLGAMTLASVVVLLVWDVFPGLFPPRAHDLLGALPLLLIAVAYIAYQVARRAASAELVKAFVLAVAFLFWAANQRWPDIPQATILNDVAIGLFVLDALLVIVGSPARIADEAPTTTLSDGGDGASS